MSETIDVKPTSGIDFRRDGRGLTLFTVGAFFTVLLALAVGSSEPLERVTGTGALARLWSVTIGVLPGLLFCAGIAGLGAWEFLDGSAKDLRRHARGLAATALGLSILMGAFSETAGGFLGHHSSGAISRYVHVVAGAVVDVWVTAGEDGGHGRILRRSRLRCRVRDARRRLPCRWFVPARVQPGPRASQGVAW